MTRTTEKRPSSAFTTIDFDRPGKQIGHISFPHSPDDDAWGVTQVPVAVIAHGRGPTVILEGGNHGDEYEGPIVIGELARELDPAEIQGRLILMPSNNVHAAMAGRRTSPVDGLNYNRTFPGDPYGSITAQISAYITDHIFPLGDAFLDLHSGGSSLDILPSAIIEPTLDKEHAARNTAAAHAFDSPNTVVIGNLGDPRTATAAACRAGLTTVGTEMAGGGRVSIDALVLCRRGTRNVLAHLGVIDAKHRTVENPEKRTFELKGASAYVYAGTDGVFEPFHKLGVRVSAGQPAGRVHALWHPGQAPEVVHYACDGIVFAHRQPGRVKPGNCCAVVAAPL